MPETCENCECSLSYDDLEAETAEIPGHMPFQEMVRSYVLSHLDVDDEADVFLSKVEICPQTVEVTYSEGV